MACAPSRSGVAARHERKRARAWGVGEELSLYEQREELGRRNKTPRGARVQFKYEREELQNRRGRFFRTSRNMPASFDLVSADMASEPRSSAISPGDDDGDARNRRAAANETARRSGSEPRREASGSGTGRRTTRVDIGYPLVGHSTVLTRASVRARVDTAVPRRG